MKAVLHENQFECYEKVFEQQKVIELTGESVVPDKMPDIGLLGETPIHTFFRVKQTEDGLGRLEGTVLATVCFIPDGTAGYHSLDVEIPWSVQFESEALKGRQETVGEATYIQAETRLLNPRKLLVKVQLQVKLTAYEKHLLTVCDDADTEHQMICAYKEQAECSVVGTVCEKTFAATDEYPLPPNLYGGNILCKSVQFRVDDIKTLVNKLIVKGSALSDVVMMTDSGYCERISITSGFSFIAETDCEGVSADARCEIMPTAMYYEVTSDGKLLSIEAHGVCQMVSYKKETVQYLSDSYSNFYECALERKTMTVYSEVKKTVHRETVSAVLPSRSQITQIQFGLCNVMMPIKKEKTISVPLRISVCVLYENGTSDWLKKDTYVEWKLGELGCVPSVRVTDLYAVSNGMEAEVRVSLEMEQFDEQEQQLDMISGIEIDEEHPYCLVRPSVTAVRRSGRVWELAKEFGSTEELIRQYNDLEEDEVVSERLLLIPKQIM